MTETLKTTYERTIQVNQFEPLKISGEVSYVKGTTPAETVNNMKEAINLGAQAVTASLGIPYEVQNGVVVEDKNAQVQASVADAFPGAVETAPTPAPAPASGSQTDEVYAFLDQYTGTDSWISGIAAKRKQFTTLSDKQIASVVNSKTKEFQQWKTAA